LCNPWIEFGHTSFSAADGNFALPAASHRLEVNLSMSNATRRPEEMAAFFNARVDGYDDHMRSSLGDLFDAFYTAVAAPIAAGMEPVDMLDLGAGTGAELATIFSRAPRARFTCVDMSPAMLEKLSERFAAQREQLTLIQGSYLDLTLPEGSFDYAVAVMTMHHFLHEPKRDLYRRIRQSLRPGGIYIEGDYYVTAAEEAESVKRREAILSQCEDGLYHIDIPFTLDTQRRLLLEAGFTAFDVMWQVGDKAVITAHR
jgi:tRNA (cmo5U34)-methyltransferase